MIVVVGVTWRPAETVSEQVQDPIVLPEPAWQVRAALAAPCVPIPNAAPKAMVLTAPRRLYFMRCPNPIPSRLIRRVAVAEDKQPACQLRN